MIDTQYYVDPVQLTQKLIQARSVSGEPDSGALKVLEQVLTPMGFTCNWLPYEGNGSYKVENLHAYYGKSKNRLAFAGHTDVVPAGDEGAWSVPPFSATIQDGELIGRGAVDMKGSIACWVSAVGHYLGVHKDFSGSLSLIITGDEEADAVNGTAKMVEWMKSNDQVPEACVVGEPTNPENLGEMIKIGRRGSINFTLEVFGIQGHVAYPEIAVNPITLLTDILHKIIHNKLDNGTEFFPPSNLEVTSVDVGNPTANLIPAKAIARFNIRFNDQHTGKALQQWVKAQCDIVTKQYKLHASSGSEAFITEPGFLSKTVALAVKKVTGKNPELSTTGGTSDARFIKLLCPVVECGLINKTAHKVDEKIAVKDLRDLTQIYLGVIEGYFAKRG